MVANDKLEYHKIHTGTFDAQYTSDKQFDYIVTLYEFIPKHQGPTKLHPLQQQFH